jgi:hypothetical protein
MAANEAIYRSGDPVFVDYTPGADVPAGEVIATVVGATAAGGVLIPHLNLSNGVLGSVSVSGGVYEVAGDAAIALGALVYWNDTNNQVTATSTGNRQFGYLVSACTGAGAKCLAYQQPA